MGNAAVLMRAELEQRLLVFVRGKLVAPELDAHVTPQTLLFEKRIIDSLKILELIAFLESATGRKIPDAQVVLANFRSIETMARTFANSDAATRPRRLDRNGGPPRNLARRFENSARGRRYSDDAATILLERGDVEWDADGGVVLRDSVFALAAYFDATVVRWAHELGATDEVFAESIDIGTLERAGFVAAFPQKLVRMDGQSDHARSPAVCYHHYPRLADRTVGEAGAVITAAGRCCRNENDNDHPLERLRAFTMREIVAVGDESFVEQTRQNLIERVSNWIVDLGLDGFIETATDPFFTSEARGRLLMQQLRPLKYELRLNVSADGRTIAAASF
ncbi:MAG: hypothetical protein ACJ8AJ_03770, partial [Gemmatimonadaceae bacterium]